MITPCFPSSRNDDPRRARRLALPAALCALLTLPAAGALGQQAPATPAPAPTVPATSTAAPAGLPGPAPAALVAAWQAIPEDPPPPALIRNAHYVTSNEDHLELFRPALHQLGGVYIGVGSEQNYLLAGWTRPEYLVLMDFDGVIADLHRVYRVAFLNAATPQEFIALWDDKHEQQLKSLVEAAYGKDDKLCQAALRALRMSRYAVRARLERLVRLYKLARTPIFLSDAGQYQVVVNLFRQNRVTMLRGDLTGPGTVLAIGEAARKSALPVRLLYLSNAERYFNYSDGFKRNMLGLPMDEQALVLRTSARVVGHYEYTVQKGLGFQAWMQRKSMVRVWQFLHMREPGAVEGAWVIKALPDEGKSAKSKSAQNG